MDFSEKWGTDVEEAVKLALIDLKLERDEVEVTVLEEPSRGFFGIGAKLAKVRVEPKKRQETVPEPFEKKEPEKAFQSVNPATQVSQEKQDIYQPSQGSDCSVKQEKKTESTRQERSERGESFDRSERTDKSDRPDHKKKRDRNKKERKRSIIPREPEENMVEVQEHPALDFLKETTEKMGLTLDITAKVGATSIFINIQGKDSGTVIGKRGQTLDAIQYLTSLVVNKENDKYTRVIVDAENYRSKREKTLEQLANRLADKVVRTKKSVRLEPMNPYERKVIHATLQHNAQVTTKSEGEEPYRRVIIELVK